jgi:radical SAM superfamily enzyme YgiQ (UPF0313 family)
MKVLLLTPPMIQLNTPYPGTTYLTGFLRQQGVDAVQADPAIELVVRLFSKLGLKRMLQVLDQKYPSLQAGVPAIVKFFLRHRDQYLTTVDSVIRFLQGWDDTFAHRILQDGFLPQGQRFNSLDQFEAQDGDPLAWAFGSLGYVDRARHLASLYVDDLADVVRDGIDPAFELAKYAERLAASAASFSPLLAKLTGESTLIDQMLTEITQELVRMHRPDVVGMSVPFPGNVYGAFRIAAVIKAAYPAVVTVMGGGFVNTELRQLRDPRVFDYFDYVTLDDGQRPLMCILERTKSRDPASPLLRTFIRQDGIVRLISDSTVHDIPFRDSGTPTYDGLPLAKYLSMVEMLNPMHRMWSYGRWNKLILAHGCYWKGCNFCDISLDYIERYEEQAADRIVDQIEQLIAETGQTGFHFVDEAAPPKVLLAMAKRLIERQVQITWWGNVRFEKTFTPNVTKILADSGCIAITGGLEVASDRLLKLMNKGVTVEQVARVTKAFSDAGVLVHAYLMYGFPTQTEQDTVDALERVRQLFANGCLQSAYWHRFVATVHSPIGRNPERFGIRILLPEVEPSFARNDLEFEDPTGIDHDAFSPGLHKAVYNFMHGIGLDYDVRSWFEFPMPKARVPKQMVRDALVQPRARSQSSI